MHRRLAEAEEPAPDRENVEVEMRLIGPPDRLFDPAPVQGSAHRVQRMGPDPAGDLEMSRVVYVVRLEEVVAGRERPDQEKPNPVPPGGWA